MAYLLQHLLADAAQRSPGKPAVISGDRSLTYEELNRLSNRLARTLVDHGVTRGDRVGILAPKSAAAVVAVFASLKAGACYVPLDVRSPDERLALIVDDCDIRILLVDSVDTARARLLTGAAPRLSLTITLDLAENSDRGAVPEPDGSGPETLAEPATVDWSEVLAASAEELDDSPGIDTDLAYMLYTSGSTGVPKGVMISHRASLTFVDWAARAAELHAGDRVCSPAPLHFDLSVFDLFASCYAGASTVVVPPTTLMFPVRLAQWMQEQEISVWYSVPSVLTILATHGNLRAFDLARLRTMIFAGEVFPAKHLTSLMRQLPHVRYLNWYGPTETNVCTWYEVPHTSEPTAPVPIGRACSNMEVFAVSEAGQRVREPGEEGELLVRGSGLMSGYWGRPDRTREALIPNPLQAAYGELVYRTGDIVTLDAHGNYVFRGRRDGMVKTRGYRVELGEVEAALYGHPAVREAVVLPVPDELLGNRLWAIVCGEGEGEPSAEDLLDHCRRRLPAYMVPDGIEFQDALPKTSTGKVDRVRLQTERAGGTLEGAR